LPERSLILPLLAFALIACGRDQAVPTSEDNRAMDAASNDLDKAANELDRVDERLPTPGNELTNTTDSAGPAVADDGHAS
jgi:hypothetical protein